MSGRRWITQLTKNQGRGSHVGGESSTASLLTIITLPCLCAAAAGWYAQVFGDADVGGPVVWVICVIALGMAWYTVKHWLAVRE